MEERAEIRKPPSSVRFPCRFRMDTVTTDALRRGGQEEEEAVTQQEQGKGVQHLQEIAEQQGSQCIAQRPEPPGEAEVDFHTFPRRSR